MASGTVANTYTIYEESKFPESEIPSLLRQIDDELLPDVSLEDNNLVFTVVVVRVLGNFERDSGKAG